jgi:hypothetical protein
MSALDSEHELIAELQTKSVVLRNNSHANALSEIHLLVETTQSSLNCG